MLSTPPSVGSRRRWTWVLLALLFTPVIVLGAAAYNYLALDSDAAFLRREMARVSGSEWKTTIQISLGRVSFAALRGGLFFANDSDIIKARDALSALSKTSVGVYQRLGESDGWTSEGLMSVTDRRMQKRGWTRVVGVIDGKDTVMVYVPSDGDELDRLCIAVINAKEMVVVSATIKPAALMDLVERHAGGGLQTAWAKLN